jgi:uncharacterized coiled-coil DUF342 family protein
MSDDELIFPAPERRIIGKLVAIDELEGLRPGDREMAETIERLTRERDDARFELEMSRQTFGQMKETCRQYHDRTEAAEAGLAKAQQERDEAHINMAEAYETAGKNHRRAEAAEAKLAKAREALAGILRNHETIGAGASIFQCTTAEVEAARAAMSAR